MTEYESELVKEVLSEAQKTKQTIEWSLERLEKLCNRLLAEAKKSEKKEVENTEKSS